MRKRVQIALAVLVVAIVGVIAWQVLRPHEREPVYQGKRLSVWLRDSSGTGELTIAVRQIGTNGIPTLLTMLSQKDSASVSKLIDLRFVAAKSLQHFGTNAQQAVPALALLLGDQISGVRDAARNALRAIDPEAAAKAGVK